MLPNDVLDPVFRATVEATEEAIVNAMIAARDMVGVDDHKVIALPHDQLRAVLKRYGRVTAATPRSTAGRSSAGRSSASTSSSD
jgi:microcompartment protein CcmL/EutN